MGLERMINKGPELLDSKFLKYDTYSMNLAQIKTHRKVSLIFPRKSQNGFTLIELLIVIVIIGILSGVLVSVINPVQQQHRANQTVMRSSLEKLHMAQLACANARLNPGARCITVGDLGVNVPDEPSDVVYTVGPGAGTPPATLYVRAVRDLNGSTAGYGTGGCMMEYIYTISTGTVASSCTGDCLVDL